MKTRARKNKSEHYRVLRAELLTRGITLRQFALDHGYALQTVYDAAKGLRGGETTLMIREKLQELTDVKTK